MTKRLAYVVAASSLVAGCSLAPAYHVPTSTPLTSAFRADPGWVPANPSDAVAKGAWWTLFGDDALNGLEAKVVITNQNVAQYRAAYAQALSVVRADRAALFPTVGVSAGVSHSGVFASGATNGTTVVTTTGTGTSGTGTGTTGTGTTGTYTTNQRGSTFSATGTASWSPDLWGSLTNTLRNARYSAQASAAQLANATLSAQGTLATDYFILRGLDAQAVMLDATVAAYRRSYEVSRNKYNAGTASSADVDSARSTLANAEANRRDLVRQRVGYETAIAVLVGENPSTFTIAPVEWKPVVPAVPGVVPSSVLERRPDIANAERLVAAANATIGVQRAAFFPSLSLTAEAGSSAGSLGALFGAASSFWSLGASAAETLIDWGARSARVAGARAAYDEAVATYRQAVLNAFQEVESNLAGVDAYREEAVQYREASQSADRAETVTRNEYRAGTVDYTTVATAQATAVSARTALIQNTVNQQSAAVALIQAIGGQWTGTVDLNPPAKAPVP
jgi:NodT family efflux transporter outer membrane factor (OMF) lipoprotein